MKLKNYLDKHSISMQAFASLIGVGRNTVWRYCAGTRFPSAKYLRLIVTATNGQVKPNDFLVR